MSCPCGSGQAYEACCGPFIAGEALPETPEQLMRSRYTAYTMAKVHYIQQTMRGQALEGFNKTRARRWAESAKWLGLRVLEHSIDVRNPDHGTVTFIAEFEEKGRRKQIAECSEFQRMNGRWFYISGVQV